LLPSSLGLGAVLVLVLVLADGSGAEEVFAWVA
jgi:hypothetical protein